MILEESLPRIVFLVSQDVCPGLTVSLSVPKPQVSLSIRVMHFRVGALGELKGKHSNKTSGERGMFLFSSQNL